MKRKPFELLFLFILFFLSVRLRRKTKCMVSKVHSVCQQSHVELQRKSGSAFQWGGSLSSEVGSRKCLLIPFTLSEGPLLVTLSPGVLFRKWGFTIPVACVSFFALGSGWTASASTASLTFFPSGASIKQANIISITLNVKRSVSSENESLPRNRYPWRFPTAANRSCSEISTAVFWRLLNEICFFTNTRHRTSLRNSCEILEEEREHEIDWSGK